MANGQKFIAGNLQMYPEGWRRGSRGGKSQRFEVTSTSSWERRGTTKREEEKEEQREREVTWIMHATQTVQNGGSVAIAYYPPLEPRSSAPPSCPVPSHTHTVLFRNQSQCHKSQCQSKICFPTVNCDCASAKEQHKAEIPYRLHTTLRQGSLSIAKGVASSDLGSL